MTPLLWSPPAILMSAPGGTHAHGHELLSMHPMCYSMHSPGAGPSVPPAPDLINPMLHRVHDITHESLPRTPPSASVSPFPSPETLNPFSRLLHTP